MGKRYTEEQIAWLKDNYGDEWHFLQSYLLSMFDEDDRDEGKAIVEALMAGENALGRLEARRKITNDAWWSNKLHNASPSPSPECFVESPVDITLGELLLYGDGISRSIYQDYLHIKENKTTPEAFQNRERDSEEACDFALDLFFSAKPQLTWGEALSNLQYARGARPTVGPLGRAFEAYEREHTVLVDRSYWLDKVIQSRNKLRVGDLILVLESAAFEKLSQKLWSDPEAKMKLEALRVEKQMGIDQDIWDAE